MKKFLRPRNDLQTDTEDMRSVSNLLRNSLEESKQIAYPVKQSVDNFIEIKKTNRK